jgi:hypothetical protein
MRKDRLTIMAALVVVALALFLPSLIHHASAAVTSWTGTTFYSPPMQFWFSQSTYHVVTTEGDTVAVTKTSFKTASNTAHIRAVPAYYTGADTLGHGHYMEICPSTTSQWRLKNPEFAPYNFYACTGDSAAVDTLITRVEGFPLVGKTFPDSVIGTSSFTANKVTLPDSSGAPILRATIATFAGTSGLYTPAVSPLTIGRSDIWIAAESLRVGRPSGTPKRGKIWLYDGGSDTSDFRVDSVGVENWRGFVQHAPANFGDDVASGDIRIYHGGYAGYTDLYGDAGKLRFTNDVVMDSSLTVQGTKVPKIVYGKARMPNGVTGDWLRCPGVRATTVGYWATMDADSVSGANIAPIAIAYYSDDTLYCTVPASKTSIRPFYWGGINP